MTTTPPQARRRAPGMSPEQRREMIVHTALPLVAEHGTAVTTSQIARAAGIGEATIFRVFADKDELLDACVAEALRPDHVLAAIAEVPLDLPLADRLTEAVTAMRAHLDRIGTVLGALHASGHRRRGRGSEHAPPDRTAALAETRDALAALFAPDAPRLRMPAVRLAGIFLGLLFFSPRVAPDTGPAPDPAELVDLFLHGALAPAADPPAGEQR